MHDISTFLTICIKGNVIISKAAVQLHKDFVWPILYDTILTFTFKTNRKSAQAQNSHTLSKLFWSLPRKDIIVSKIAW